MFTVSTLSKGRNFTKKRVRHCCRKRQRLCQSNIRLCRKNRSTCCILLCCFDNVAAVNGALVCVNNLLRVVTWQRNLLKRRKSKPRRLFLKSLGLHQDVTRPACRFCFVCNTATVRKRRSTTFTLIRWRLKMRVYIRVLMRLASERKPVLRCQLYLLPRLNPHRLPGCQVPPDIRPDCLSPVLTMKVRSVHMTYNFQTRLHASKWVIS